MKSGGARQRVDFGDRFLQRADHILVRVFVKTDVAVADLHKAEIAADQRSRRAEHL